MRSQNQCRKKHAHRDAEGNLKCKSYADVLTSHCDAMVNLERSSCAEDAEEILQLVTGYRRYSSLFSEEPSQRTPCFNKKNPRETKCSSLVFTRRERRALVRRRPSRYLEGDRRIPTCQSRRFGSVKFCGAVVSVACSVNFISLLNLASSAQSRLW